MIFSKQKKNVDRHDEFDHGSYGVTGDDEKFNAEHVEGSRASNSDVPIRAMEAPELVRNLTEEDRVILENKLRRKIDIRLMPMVILMYILNYLDRNAIATARLAGLTEELNLSTTQYQFALSILFVGYILMQIPSNLLLNKLGKPAIYLPACMVVWGIVSAAAGAVQNFAGLAAVRFFLGFVEAAYFPGCLFYLSSWYTRKELAFRTAILYSGSLISGAFAGLIAAGIVDGMDGDLGLRAWRWLFIIEGVITVVVAIGAFWVLPNFPRTTTWLSEEERQIAIWRLQEDVGMDDWTGSADQGFLHGLKLACQDIKMWILMFLLHCVVGAGAVTLLFPTIVGTLGYNRINTLLLTAPPYLLAVITTFINAWHADRTGERFWHISGPLLVGLIAFVGGEVTIALNAPVGARYLFMMLMIPGIYTGYVVVLAWISNTIPRPPAKRAASLAAINAVSNAAQIWAPYMYKGPQYIAANTVNCVIIVLSIMAALTLRIILQRLNKKLDRGEPVEGAVVMGAGVNEATKKGFRFLV